MSWGWKRRLWAWQEGAGVVPGWPQRPQEAPSVAPSGPSDLQVLMFRHDGDLVAIDAEDFALQVDQLTLAHLHVVAGLEVVLSFLPCGNGGDSEGTALQGGQWGDDGSGTRLPVLSVTTSRSMPSGWSSNFSSSDRVGFTPSVICQEWKRWPKPTQLRSYWPPTTPQR